jgi:hypothetical protein
MEQKYFSRHQQQEAAARPLQTSYLASPAPIPPGYPAREREVMLADINKLLEEVSSKHNDNIKGQTRAEFCLIYVRFWKFLMYSSSAKISRSRGHQILTVRKKGENCPIKTLHSYFLLIHI